VCCDFACANRSANGVTRASVGGVNMNPIVEQVIVRLLRFVPMPDLFLLTGGQGEGGGGGAKGGEGVDTGVDAGDPGERGTSGAAAAVMTTEGDPLNGGHLVIKPPNGGDVVANGKARGNPIARRTHTPACAFRVTCRARQMGPAVAT